MTDERNGAIVSEIATTVGTGRRYVTFANGTATTTRMIQRRRFGVDQGGIDFNNILIVISWTRISVGEDRAIFWNTFIGMRR
jgi:hypothetical protein